MRRLFLTHVSYPMLLDELFSSDEWCNIRGWKHTEVIIFTSITIIIHRVKFQDYTESTALHRLLDMCMFQSDRPSLPKWRDASVFPRNPDKMHHAAEEVKSSRVKSFPSVNCHCHKSKVNRSYSLATVLSPSPTFWFDQVNWLISRAAFFNLSLRTHFFRNVDTGNSGDGIQRTIKGVV